MTTAMEVMKGSLAAVLGFPIGKSTIGGRISEGNKGRITVFTGRTTPTAAQTQAVMDHANELIAKDLPCCRFSMLRSEAESTYGTAMYDKADVPAHVTELSMLYIEGVVLHSVQHQSLPSTGGVGKITVTKQKFREAKQELEVQFDVEPAEMADGVVSPCPQCAPPPADAIAVLNSTEVRAVTREASAHSTPG